MSALKKKNLLPLACRFALQLFNKKGVGRSRRVHDQRSQLVWLALQSGPLGPVDPVRTILAPFGSGLGSTLGHLFEVTADLFFRATKSP
jgi:hypothetical protein